MDEGVGFNKFARGLQEKVNDKIKKNNYGRSCVLGTYYGNYLKLDNSTLTITDFSILDHLKKNYFTATYNNNEIKITNPFKVVSGDRVVVQEFGADFIIIGKV